MSRLPNIFENFTNLYQISIPQIQSKLSFTLHPVVVENYVANRLLFPQAVPTTKIEVQLEMAILSAVVTLNHGFFYNQTLSKISIPSDYTQVYPDIDRLVQTVIESVGLQGQAAINIPNPGGHDTQGTAIALPPKPSSIIIYNNRQTTLKSGGVVHLPPAAQTSVTIDQTIHQVVPGQLGIYIFYAK